MSTNKNIANHKNSGDEKMLEYLSGNLPDEQRYAEELAHIDDDFWNDAVEGLNELEDKESLKKLQMQLQQGVRQKTEKGKNRRKRNFMSPSIIAIFVIILIILVSYLYIHFAK